MKLFFLLPALLYSLIAFGAPAPISSFNSLPQSAWSSGDVFPIVDISASETKKTSVADFDGRYVLQSGFTTGIISLNGLSTTAQSFAFGATGTAPNIVSSGSTHTIHIPLASGLGVTSGAISKAEYDIFNGKQNAGNYLTQLTGDGTALGPGSSSFTLATVNSNVGSFGSASDALSATVNEKGLITAISSTPVQISESQVNGLINHLESKATTANLAPIAFTGDSTNLNVISTLLFPESLGIGWQEAGNDTYVTSPSDGQIDFYGNAGLGMSLDASHNLNVQGTITASNFPIIGTANTFTYFDAGGNLASLPSWSYTPATQAIASNFTYHPDNTQISLISHEREISALTDNQSSNVTGYNHDFHIDRSNTGFRTGAFTGISQGISVEGDVQTENLMGMNLEITAGLGSNSGTTGTITMLNLTPRVGQNFSSDQVYGLSIFGGSSASSSIGGYSGIHQNPQFHGTLVNYVGIANDGQTDGGLGNFSSLEQNPSIDNADFTNYRAVNSSPRFGQGSTTIVAGAIGYNYNPVFDAYSRVGNTVGFWDAQNFIGGSEIDNGYSGFLSNPQIDGPSYNSHVSYSSQPNIGSTSTASISTYNDINLSPSFRSNSIIGQYQGITSGPVFDSGSSVGFYTDIDLHANIGTTLTGPYRGVVINPTVSGTSFTGALIVPQTGSFSGDVTGLNININSLNSGDGFKTAIQTNGGRISSQYEVDTANVTIPPYIYSANSINPTFIVSDGHPITANGAGTPPFGFMNNFGGTLGFADDIETDFTGANLGLSFFGQFGQVNGVGGKTVAALNFNASAASFSSASTGGTISNLSGYRYLGILPDGSGGTLNITNESAFLADQTMDTNPATNMWAFKSDCSGCESYMPKLAIGTSSKKVTPGLKLEIAGDAKIHGDLEVGSLTMGPTSISTTVFGYIDPTSSIQAQLDSKWTTADFVGDSGSGGFHGLVPAPSAGDAALGYFLNAGGTWSAPGGGGGGITSLNGLIAGVQIFSTGTSGTAPNFNSLIATHELNIPLASASGVTSGTISKTEYDLFNGKQDAGDYLTELTGDGTAIGPGISALTLASVNTNIGIFGGMDNVPSITANAKGLITSISTTSIQITESQVFGLVSDLAGKQALGSYLTGLSGDGTTSGPGVGALILSTVNSNTGAFGSASVIPSFAVNGKGLITSVSTNAIQITESQVTGLVTDLASKQSALTFGTISSSNTALTVTNGANSTVGPSVSFSIQNASTSQPGIITAQDFTTFNSKLSSEIVEIYDLTLSNFEAVNGYAYFKAPANLTFSAASVQLYTKDGISSGTLTVDIKKASTINGAYSSIFSAAPSFNFATASDGDASAGTQSSTTCSSGDYLRLDVSSVPTGWSGKVHILFFGTK